MNKMNKLPALALSFMLLMSLSSTAKNYTYKGIVTGMACAFCSYNVAKKIAQVNGINESSINLDLKSGEVGFVSTVPIKKSEISQLLTNTGFKLVELTEVNKSKLSELEFQKNPLISMSFSISELSKMGDILDAFGVLAASQTTQLSVMAPKQIEPDVLKSIIGGQQRAIKVHFKPVENNKIKIILSVSSNTN
ncbi:MAG: heavy-metal-associated domain-containing protein [Proteobacteria bacterium]|nr:heavy-metal-associated domain-containing protein [Pseudomonadota bacterium]